MSRIRATFRIDRGGFLLDADLTLPGRGVTALFGHSGSGKTTVLRAMAGLERSPGGSGDYFALGDVVWQDAAKGIFVPPHRRAIGYVFQEASLFEHLTVQGNLEFGYKRIPEPERRFRLPDVAGLLGIGDLLKRRPNGLSGGERQRVAIGRALLSAPQLLLMDEPLAALDHERKQEILPYLERLHDELSIPVIYVSHSPDEVARLADHLVVLQQGKVLAAGPLGETLARIDLPIRLGDDAGVVIEGTIVERDTAWHLARAEFAGGSLWIRDNGLPVGQRTRLRILARDVSLARERRDDSSILNTLPVRVVALADDVHPALALVQLRIGETTLIARLTYRSAERLRITPGSALWAQVKAVALIA